MNVPRRAVKVQAIWPLAALIIGVATFSLTAGALIGHSAGVGSAAERAVSTVVVSGPAETIAGQSATPLAPPPVAPSPTPTPTPTLTDAPVRSGNLPPVEAPRGRGLLHLAPVRVDIPAIGVSSSLVDLRLNPDSSIQVPEDAAKPGWYVNGSYPGDVDAPPALIVGHLDDDKGPAVFHALKDLKVNDQIAVTRTDGSVAVFVVYDARQHPKSTLPTEEIYQKRQESDLLLITCAGGYDRNEASYLDNYVVSARLDATLSGVGV